MAERLLTLSAAFPASKPVTPFMHEIPGLLSGLLHSSRRPVQTLQDAQQLPRPRRRQRRIRPQPEERPHLVPSALMGPGYAWSKSSSTRPPTRPTQRGPATSSTDSDKRCSMLWVELKGPNR